MIQEGEKQVTQRVCILVFCNLCGTEIPKNDDFGWEFATLKASWGYMSGHDTETFELHFCEKCVYGRLLPMLKVLPEIREEL